MKTTLLAILATLFLSSAYADQTPEYKSDDKKAAAEVKIDPKVAAMMKAWEELATPGDAHKKLKEMEGDWKYTSTWWQAPGAKPEESKGESEMEMILGDRFLQHKLKGKSMGKDFNGLGFTGYDNLKKKYNTIWLDSMSTAMVLGTGSYDAKTNTYSEKGKMSCPEKKGKDMAYRAEWKIVDKNNMTYAMYGADKKGKEFKQMEIVYKRD